MMTDRRRPYFGLFEYLKLHHISQGQVARWLGLSLSSVNLKMNRRYGRDFTFTEAYILQKKLGLTSDDFFIMSPTRLQSSVK